jgi:hypothetical protein
VEWHINSREWDAGEATLEDNVAIVGLRLLASSLNAIVDYFLQHFFDVSCDQVLVEGNKGGYERIALSGY